MPTNGNMNPMQLVNMIKKGGNPQQMVMNMLEESSKNNPMFANILGLVQNGNKQEVENIVRNMAQERGMDFDKEFNSFKQMFGL